MSSRQRSLTCTRSIAHQSVCAFLLERGVAVHPKLTTQRGVFLRHRLWIELARRAAHHVDDEAIAFLVPDADRIGIGANAATGVDEGDIDDTVNW